MAERVDLRRKAFRHKFQIRLKYGFLPVIHYRRNKYRSEFFWRYRWANSNLKNLDVLELPCGMGWGTKLLQKAKSVFATDIDPDSVKQATIICNKPRSSFFVSDMCFIPIASRSMDAICCLEGIEHVPKSAGELFLSESHRVLKDSGLLLISSPYAKNGTHSGNPYHLHEYLPGELESLMEGKFSVLEITKRQVDNLIIQYFKCQKI